MRRDPLVDPRTRGTGSRIVNFSKLIDIAKVGFALAGPIMEAVRRPSVESEARAFEALDAFRKSEREKIDAALIRKHAQ